MIYFVLWFGLGFIALILGIYLGKRNGCKYTRGDVLENSIWVLTGPCIGLYMIYCWLDFNTDIIDAIKSWLDKEI